MEKGAFLNKNKPAGKLNGVSMKESPFYSATLDTLRQVFSRPLALIGLIIIVLTVLGAIFAPWLTPYGMNEQSFDGLSLQGGPLPPSHEYWLGTDLLGRDLLTRLLYGARTSLIVGIAANGAAIIIGTVVGLFAGFYRGWVESLLMRSTDLVMAFPALILGICIASVLTPSLWIVALVIALVNWGQVARVIFTETCSLAKREYIDAERAIGAGTFRILTKHIFPHLLPTIFVYGTLGISITVLLEATLSYLGVGVQPPMPSWGNIIFENQTYIELAPWLVIFPGLAILLLSLAFNLVGDALREVLDPTQRGGR